jgi:alkyldihydroxyacetonephosphate synthase
MTDSGRPTPPIALETPPEQVTSRLISPRVEVDAALLDRLRGACTSVLVDDASVVEASRDWWPLTTVWSLEGHVAVRAAAVARPADAAEVAAVLALCNEARVPVTAAGGRSGVCGASVPLHGGVVLDLTELSGIVDVDTESMVLDVLPGTFGTWLEDTMRAEHGATIGHWPQSIDLSTVGGWLACRGAGQMSTRYGKIEDMVVGLDVVLADGTELHTGGWPRAAVGPDLTQLFVGSEGTLGIITGARLRLHPAPRFERRAAYAFTGFAEGLDACRRILHRGATPAVIRLYDAIEADRSFATGNDRHVLLIMDEGDPLIVDAMMAVVADECATAENLDAELVGKWLGHRNDVSALEALIRRDYVVDTMEISAEWSRCAAIYEAATAAIRAVPGALVASAHQSHSYSDGACLYFTFAGQPPADGKDAFYAAAWEAGTRAVLEHGGALSHHHGVGLNRSRFVRDALGSAFPVLESVKAVLDPNGILNPGKLGLLDPWGDPTWP